MSNNNNDFSSTLNDLKRSLVDAVPVLTRFLSALWNLFMKGLIAIRVMPYLVQMPWLLGALILVMILILPPLLIILLPMSLVAYSRGVTAAENFLIPQRDSVVLDDIDQIPD